MTALRKLILGSKRIPSRQDYKFAMLRAEFALLIAFVATFYVVLDIVNGMYSFLPWYGFMFTVAIVALVMNRRGRYTAASLFILTTINLIIFIFADADHPQGGVYFFFMSTSVAGLILFSNSSLTLRLLFGVLPIVLAFVARLWDFHIVEPPSQDPTIVQINFFANFTIGLLTSVLIIMFLINRNRESERSLLAGEQAVMKASEDLKRSEERMGLALQGTRAGIYEWHVQENRVEVSPHWKSLLGYSPSEMLHVTLETFLTMVHPEDAARTSASVMSHVKNQLPYQNEVRLRTREGEYRWFQDSGIGKADAHGALQVVIGSIIDIHERKEAEEKIRQQNELLAKANKELDYFVYSVSHDLRAPLSSILGLTSIYAMSKSPGEKDEIVKMISDRANVLDDFIREVLDYSRNSRLVLKLQPVLLWELVDDLLRGLAHMEGYGAIDIRVDVPSDLTVETDPDRVKVILSNLLTNAIHYRDHGKASFIIVRASRLPDEWNLSVEDNGIGIKREHLPNVFDMFYKAHDTSKGSGLGLYIANEAAHRLHGVLEVASEYGKGTSFKLRIPLPVNAS
jgi:PAS domain S-box-containing protein